MTLAVDINHCNRLKTCGYNNVLNSPIHMVEHNHEWDAGDLGCGELVLGVRKRLRAHPGQVLKLLALDTGAVVDLQAYCNMTGDELLAVDSAARTYWLRGRI